MLKTLKWVYDLGVRQERVRIAAHLKTRSAELLSAASYRRNMLDDPKSNMSATRKAKLHNSAQLDEAVANFIHEILEPNWEQTMSSSIMFPDDKHKGEM